MFINRDVYRNNSGGKVDIQIFLYACATFCELPSNINTMNRNYCVVVLDFEE